MSPRRIFAALLCLAAVAGALVAFDRSGRIMGAGVLGGPVGPAPIAECHEPWPISCGNCHLRAAKAA